MLKRCVMVTCSALAATTALAAWSAPPLDPATCKPAGSLMRLTGLSEASGLVVSRATPGRLWSHNDSGKPEIVAFDAKGNVTGHLSISGARVEDWEAMATAPCGSGSCLYVADIGDNDAKRHEITIYGVPEPAKAGGSAQVDAVMRASYPDGAHDAEALLASPDGTLFVVTKGDTGQVALYRVPREARGGEAMRLERVGAAAVKGITGCERPHHRWRDFSRRRAGSCCARWHADLLSAADFLKGNFRELQRVDLTSLGEPQGEGVAFGPSNTVYVAGEGGGKTQPGTLAVAVVRELRPRPAVILAAVAALAVATCARQVRNVQVTPARRPPSPSCGRHQPSRAISFTAREGRSFCQATAPFTFVAEDTTGYSPGFDVTDATGMEWSVKTGPEAQTEVVTSRILWAIGFHQPPTYYVEQWSMTGAPPARSNRRVSVPTCQVATSSATGRGMRIRSSASRGVRRSDRREPDAHELGLEDVQQQDLPARHSRSMASRGGSWCATLAPRSGSSPIRRCSGCSGCAASARARRNDLPGFEQQGFIERVDDGSVNFDYRGIYRDVISTVTRGAGPLGLRAAVAADDGSGRTRSAAAATRPIKRAATRIRSRRRSRKGLQLTGAAH